ncbi:MAG: Acetolactate synthase large subunit IlvB1 [Candidatus Moanabacter tarae]|uniref:Acetolactate synthase n=1 Tax=Candidatus Moanibacter tarae TaxID=2200854 RepID=A0A2Z4AHI1_9BACT|nr:MAG: Acetolactate synthase large subunit IlvB1 [Candidatus Moanabacter tarae]|tara:strand:+ start:94457 stop:96238 length:1782 start_codon:yes stop_codon:yes gene_type:complete
MKPEKLVTFPQDDEGPEMNGADILVTALEREGVEIVFAYPGGASMELHQSLTKSQKIRTILPRFEQGGGFMAHGYARATGKAGVCMATSGPGATNLMTCITDAFMDSIPLIAITGQVHQWNIGKAAFQETDFFGMTLPVVKHSYLVLDIQDLPKVIKHAFFLATTGRPGPVVIDIPKDIQQELSKPLFPGSINIPGYQPEPHARDEDLKVVLELIEKSKRPVFYTGGGIISGNSQKELTALSEITGVPVATTLMGLGAFPESHKHSLRWFGMHGTVAGNWAVCESDLLITAGARFDDRITGAPASKFAPDAVVVHIDIDKSEHQKNKTVRHPIHSDVRYALGRLVHLAKETGFKKPDLEYWYKQLATWQKQHPFNYERDDRFVLGQEAIEALYHQTDGEAIITTGVGQHQMWAAQFYKFHKPRSYLSSLGLGAMGFGLPAAIGAKVACPDRTVVDVDGDGSFLMNIQELATAVIEKIPVKILLLNNQHLGMVMQWEDLIYEGVRAQTILGDPENIGSPENPAGLYPNFVKMAESFGCPARQVILKKELKDGIDEMLECDSPFLLEVVSHYDEHVLPMIQQGKSAKEILLQPPG